MNYIKQKTIDEFKILQEWHKDDRPNDPSRYKQLADAAYKAKHSKTHVLLNTQYSYEEDRLLDIFYQSLLNQKSFGTEKTPKCGYLPYEAPYAIPAFYYEGFLVFNLHIGCGSSMTCEYVKRVPKGVKMYTYDTLRMLIDHKYKIYKKKVLQISKELHEAQVRKEELQKTLAAVDTANSLMSIFGLRMDEESENKVIAWRKELEQVRKV